MEGFCGANGIHWGLLGPFGGLLGPFGAILGPFWGHFGTFAAFMDPIGEPSLTHPRFALLLWCLERGHNGRSLERPFDATHTDSTFMHVFATRVGIDVPSLGAKQHGTFCLDLSEQSHHDGGAFPAGWCRRHRRQTATHPALRYASPRAGPLPLRRVGFEVLALFARV